MRMDLLGKAAAGSCACADETRRNATTIRMFLISVQLCVGRFHDRRPAREVGLDLRAELLGRFATGSMPSRSNRSRKSGRRITVTESSWTFLTMSRGVPAGAMNPYQAVISKPGRVSAIAGTSGIAFALLGPVTPSALSLPLRVSWIEA